MSYETTESKSQPAYAIGYSRKEDGTFDMRHRIFNFRLPVDRPALEVALEKLQDQASPVTNTYIMPVLTPGVLSAVVSTRESSDWVKPIAGNPPAEAEGRPAVLVNVVEAAIKAVAQNSPLDP